VKTKHNKKRNTAFLYECLISELTKTSYEKNEQRKRKVLSILKEHFNSNSPLGKELKIYKMLLETRCSSYNIASRFLKKAEEEWQTVVSNQDLYKEQSRVITKINSELDDSVFRNFIPNYKNLATISQIFNKSTSAKIKTVLEESFINFLCKEEERERTTLEKPDNLTYRFFVDKFNKEYSESLLEEQKKILAYYVMSFEDGGNSLKTYLNEEIGRLKQNIELYILKEEDSELKNKSQRVHDYLVSLSKRKMNERDIQKVMEIQDFVKETGVE
jgi:hypothetical protein